MKTHSAFRTGIAALTALALLLHPALLPQVHAGNPHCRPHAQHAPPRPHGVSPGGWLVSYWDWFMGDGAGSLRGVKFLPLPEGEETGGSFTFDDPGVLEGEVTVSLRRGESFMVPIVTWIGELYEDGSEDEPLEESVMNEGEFLVTIDGRTVAHKAAGRSSPLYSAAHDFDEPILYDEPTDYGSIGALWAQGFPLVHHPLPPGRHVMKLHATLLIEELDLGLQFENTWIINVTR